MLSLVDNVRAKDDIKGGRQDVGFRFCCRRQRPVQGVTVDEDVVEDGWKVDVDVGLHVAEYGVGFGFGVGVTRATVLRPPA